MGARARRSVVKVDALIDARSVPCSATYIRPWPSHSRSETNDPRSLWTRRSPLTPAAFAAGSGWLLRSAVAHDPQLSSGDGEHEPGGHDGYLEQARACRGRSARVGQHRDPDQAAGDR